MSDIKLAVSLYSFSSDFINGELDLDGILKAVKDMGYEGIEIVAAQMVPEYPYPSDAWLSEFKSLLQKHGLSPVCWSAYVDMGLTTGRELSREEILQFTLNDMIYAKKAGFPLVRTQYTISPDIFRSMLPHCKRLNMKLCIEMHHPHHPEVPVWKEYIRICKEEGEGFLGIVPDCGIFQNHPHKLFLDQALELGFRPEVLNRLVTEHGNGAELQTVCEALSLNETEKQVAEDLYHTFNQPARAGQLQELIPISPYFHGKFYYAEDGENDPCIPYDDILPEIARLGFDGFMACEYEGHHFVDCYEVDTAEQLRRYVAMHRRILGGV